MFGKRFKFFFISIVAVTGFSIAAQAQLSGMEMYPQLQQQTPSAAERSQAGVNVPSITGESGMGTGLLNLPEGRQPEFAEQYDILLDKKIDPEEYIVGPGDYLSVYLWGELDQQYAGRVTPEGNIIIPTVGAVMVSDITLSDAEARILEAVNRAYNGIEVTVSLLRPRRFRLFVTGVVERPAAYEANALRRVSDLFVELDSSLFPEEAEETTTVQQQPNAATQTPQQQQPRITEIDFPSAYIEGLKAGLRMRSDDSSRDEKKASSKRGIVIYRGDEEIPVDLLRFEKLGDIDANPYVSGGDRIFVPGYIGDIIVEGEVTDPGIYEFKPGDTVADLVAFGGGLTAIADSSATLVRFSSNGRDLVNIPIDLHDALVVNPRDTEYLLQESDRLFITARYDYKKLANVRVRGEVKFPGYYAITENVTRLTDVISLAGGFTGDANLAEARIVKDKKNTPADPEYQRLQLIPVEQMTDEEYEYYKWQSRSLQNNIAIDFVKLFRENDASQNIFLEDGDTITIPAGSDMIHVIGAVDVPGFIRVEPGADYRHYIEKAGGYNWNAKTRHIRIVKAKTGQQLKPDDDTAVEAGDTILVPERRPRDIWALTQQSIQLLANIATVVLIVHNVSN